MEEIVRDVNGKRFIIKSDPTAVLIEEYRIGDQVMVLKEKYGEEYAMFPGVIVGFYEFKSLPTIYVAYLNVEYASAKIEFVAFNDKLKDVEFCRFAGNDLPYGKERVLHLLDGEIEKKESELRDAKHKKSCFVECFGRFFAKTNVKA